MTDPRKPLHNQLTELEVAAAAAGERCMVAQRRVQAAGRSQVAYPAKTGMAGDGVSETGRGVFAELAAYRHAIHASRPDAIAESHRPAWEREMTERVVAEIRERGLVFSPNADGWSVTLVDPTLVPAYDAARDEADRAKTAVHRFVNDNADALAVEDAAATDADFAQALTNADTEAVAGIIRVTQEAQARREAAEAAMTTRDLPNRRAAAEEADRARAQARFRAEADAERQRLEAEREKREAEARRVAAL